MKIINVKGNSPFPDGIHNPTGPNIILYPKIARIRCIEAVAGSCWADCETQTEMAKAKKKLVASAPWRGEEDDAGEEFKDAKLKVTNQPGGTPTMHVPRKKSLRSKDQDPDDSLAEIDPELRYSFQRNFQVPFSSPHFLLSFFFFHFTFHHHFVVFSLFSCLVSEFCW